MNFKQFPIRELDNGFVEILKNRIKNEGYNKSKPLSVVKKDGVFLIFDGNHRYEACKQLGIKDIPFVEYPESTDLIGSGIRANRDEETSKPMTFLDYAFLCSRLHKGGKKDDDIAKTLTDSSDKWDRIKAQRHRSIVEKVNPEVIEKVTRILKMGTSYENGMVTLNVPTVTFTERMFRDIIPLNSENQFYIIQEIIKNNGKLKGQKLKGLCEKRKLFEEMEKYVNENLLNDDAKKELLKDINNSVYDNIKQVEDKVGQLNKDVQKHLICGDAIEELKKIDDGYIDVVITDPPYGIEYLSNHRLIKDDITKPISNDERDNAITILSDAVNLLYNKMKPDAHFYCFCNWVMYPEFKQIIEAKFNIKNLLIWVKNNWGMGDLEGRYANQYELIIFATKGNKKLIGRRDSDILSYDRVAGKKQLHSAQKPVDLLKFLIEKSATEGDVVCDPFMGVGSTIVACGDRNPYIGIEIEEKYYKIAKRRVESE